MRLKVLVSTVAVTLVTAAAFVTHHVSAQEKPQHIAIVAKRFDFSPGDVTVKKGVPVTIALTSEDVDHGVKFRELNVVVNAKKGETKEVTFTPDKVGTFVGQCSIFCGAGHGAMKMTLHVTE
jgi:cytochrome c oxidase subunit II